MSAQSGYVVSFKDVGACKRSWDAAVSAIDYKSLLNAVRKQGAVMSRSIEFCTDDDARTGSIFVGVFRCIGTFTWRPIEETAGGAA